MREKARKFLRKGLDSYEGRFEKKDDRYSSWISRGMDALDDRPTLKRFFYVLLVLEGAYWSLVLFLPLEVFRFFEFLDEWSNKGIVIVVGIVFGTGLYIAYVLFRFKFPNLEDTPPEGGPVIGAYTQQAGNERKFRVWIASVVVGILNLLTLTIVELLRIGH